jgi:hypothetical protein
MDHRTDMILRGVVSAIAILGFMLITFAIIENNSEPIEKFQVVDKYKNCNVVRYTDPSNQWHYLLHCGL